MPRSRYRVIQNPCPHFMTATVNHWLPLFTRPETVNIILDSWRFLQQDSGCELYGYLILENHSLCFPSSSLGTLIPEAPASVPTNRTGAITCPVAATESYKIPVRIL